MQILLTLCILAVGPAPERIIHPDRPNEISFSATQARLVRLVIHESSGGQPCIDELEVYGPDGGPNLALAETGARASASSCLPGYAIHQVAHLNDGRYGNSRSWIASGSGEEWVQIELPGPAQVARVVFSRDREGQYRDRVPVHLEALVSRDGTSWTSAGVVRGRVAAPPAPPPRGWPPAPFPGAEDKALTRALEEGELVRYAFLCEARTWRIADESPPLSRTLRQLEALVERFARRGLDVTRERRELTRLCAREKQLSEMEPGDLEAEETAYLDARGVKRRLLFRDPDLDPLGRILFVKRHPFEPSHNYSVLLDGRFRPGGGIHVLDIPREHGRLDPSHAEVRCLFDAGEGMARTPAADFEVRRIYFSYRPSEDDYYRILVMNAEGREVRELTAGKPFHDFWPCPLPDGGLAFISTRCKARFLCWRPQAFVLFRMDADGSAVRPLSFANLSEWAPSVMSDGRIVWTRSEYLDKGADFGHTLWAIRPDGTHPELLFGNNTLHAYANGRQVPGTGELCATLVCHAGDFNGPVALIDRRLGPFNPRAIRNITPDVEPAYGMSGSWPRARCFRDPVPISRDYVLCSHSPHGPFGLYVIDRHGNRELLYLDPAIGSMCPTPLEPRPRPPVILAGKEPSVSAGTRPAAELFIADIYEGLGPDVPRGSVRWVRVCEEIRSGLARLPGGEYQADHPPFQDYYASPTHKVRGPHGWPSYVAKGTCGVAPVEPDGSARFSAPAGKVIYLQALDADFNEVQRMRSVLQLQPGEKRSCIGCHEDRARTPSVRPALALSREPSALEEPPWGAGPFSYEQVVQPVWDAHCIRCHDANDRNGRNLTGTLDAERVPASYRTLIEQGWVHYFDYTWGTKHFRAEPLTFGTVRSRLWNVLEDGHHEVRLTLEEERRVKCWTDLNCPLWPDYRYRPEREGRR